MEGYYLFQKKYRVLKIYKYLKSLNFLVLLYRNQEKEIFLLTRCVNIAVIILYCKMAIGADAKYNFYFQGRRYFHDNKKTAHFICFHRFFYFR